MSRLKNNIKDAILIIIGSEITAIGVISFTNPAELASGGVTGLSTILFHTIGMDPALSLLLLSIPIYLSGLYVFGWKYGIKSLIGNALLIVCMYLTAQVFGYQGFLPIDKDPLNLLLNSIFGGFIIGLGLTFVFKGGANTGGTDTIAQILARVARIPIGTSLLLIDGLVVLIGAYFFGLNKAFLAIITIFTVSQVINYLTLTFGTNTAKSVYIISEDIGKISSRFIEELDLGGTILKGQGIYTHKEKNVLLTITPNSKLSMVNRIVHEEDPAAFMIITQTHQILGEGFRPIGIGLPSDGIPNEKVKVRQKPQG